jgi:hypothetical protein
MKKLTIIIALLSCSCAVDLDWLQTADGENYLEWSRDVLPISVWLGPGLTSVHRQGFYNARMAINAAIGRQVLDFGTALPGAMNLNRLLRGHMAIVAGAFSEGAAASTSHKWHPDTGEILSAMIGVELILEQGMADGIMQHELLHVLGLTHDNDDPDSIMYPSYRAGQRITAGDLDRLRDVYGAGR